MEKPTGDLEFNIEPPMKIGHRRPASLLQYGTIYWSHFEARKWTHFFTKKWNHFLTKKWVHFLAKKWTTFCSKSGPLFEQKVVGRVPLLSTPAATPDFRLKILGVSGPRKKCRKEGCPACGITCARRVEAVLPFFSGAVVAAFYVKKT